MLRWVLSNLCLPHTFCGWKRVPEIFPIYPLILFFPQPLPWGPTPQPPWPNQPSRKMPLVMTGTPARRASEVTPKPPCEIWQNDEVFCWWWSFQKIMRPKDPQLGWNNSNYSTHYKADLVDDPKIILTGVCRFKNHKKPAGGKIHDFKQLLTMLYVGWVLL